LLNFPLDFSSTKGALTTGLIGLNFQVQREDNKDTQTIFRHTHRTPKGSPLHHKAINWSYSLLSTSLLFFNLLMFINTLAPHFLDASPRRSDTLSAKMVHLKTDPLKRIQSQQKLLDDKVSAQNTCRPANQKLAPAPVCFAPKQPLASSLYCPLKKSYSLTNLSSNDNKLRTLNQDAAYAINRRLRLIGLYYYPLFYA
jgi:hypothetical protein